jgi:hypothetical protein
VLVQRLDARHLKVDGVPRNRDADAGLNRRARTQCAGTVLEDRRTKAFRGDLWKSPCEIRWREPLDRMTEARQRVKRLVDVRVIRRPEEERACHGQQAFVRIALEPAPLLE